LIKASQPPRGSNAKEPNGTWPNNATKAPSRADRALAAEGRTAHEHHGEQRRGGAETERRSPADERPAPTIASPCQKKPASRSKLMKP
jgi:hypothetical protein